MSFSEAQAKVVAEPPMFGEDPEVQVIDNTMMTMSLEWCLSSPPPAHQFPESPIVVEVEGLNNLKLPDLEH